MKIKKTPDDLEFSLVEDLDIPFITSECKQTSVTYLNKRQSRVRSLEGTKVSIKEEEINS